MLGVHFRRWTLNMNYEKLILLVKLISSGRLL